MAAGVFNNGELFAASSCLQMQCPPKRIAEALGSCPLLHDFWHPCCKAPMIRLRLAGGGVWR